MYCYSSINYLFFFFFLFYILNYFLKNKTIFYLKIIIIIL